MEFLRQKRLSFLYGGKSFLEQSPAVSVREDGDSLVTEYRFPDGLKVTNTARKYPEFDAYEWVTWFEMTGEGSSEVISQLWDSDVDVDWAGVPEKYRRTAWLPEKDGAMKVFCPVGAIWGDDEFFCDADRLAENRYENHLYQDMVKEYATRGGKSCNEKAPFFNIAHGDKGVIFAIGWTGQWNCRVTGTPEGVNIRAGIEDVCFRLLPGEKLRTASMVMMRYECGHDEAQNKWRRLMKAHFSLIGRPGRAQVGPLCAGVWGGMKTRDVIERIRLIRERQLPYEYLWMDAGWYGTGAAESPDEYEGDWYTQVGDWRVNEHHHPDGLMEVRDEARRAGLRFLLWFEPERVREQAPVIAAHPEYFLEVPRAADTKVLDLGREDAWQYCFDTLSGMIEKLGIDCYRQDFNIDPLGTWRAHDREDRRGITEIRYINGLYRLWDALLAHFPELLIDNCAGGGRRIDIELARRSMPLWRSDAQCPADCDIEMMQLHGMNYSAWMPYSGQGSGRIWLDTYRMRSAYAGAMTTNYFFSARDPLEQDDEKIDWLRRHLQEYRQVRPYFYGDFYPLTAPVRDDTAWCASQYHRPEDGDGIVQVFKREKSPFTAAIFPMKGLDPDKRYRFTDADNGTVQEHSGRELMEQGLEVLIRERRVAKLYFYREA